MSVLLSKIVANSTEFCWAQAYSTQNFYLVLSVEQKEATENIGSVGKEILDKIQRSFFALEEKELEGIKKALSDSIEPYGNFDISCVLATIKENALYIVTFGEGRVSIKRGDEFGIVAQGEEGSVDSFSGLLENGDIIILQTKGFARKIIGARLRELLDDLEINDVAENIAPILHEDTTGSEAAIVMKYIAEQKESFPEEEGKEEAEEAGEEEQTIEETYKKEEEYYPQIKTSRFSAFPVQKMIKGKAIILLLIAILLVLLVGGVFFEKRRQERARIEQEFSKVVSPLEKKYKEAVALIDLNQGIAIENLSDIKNSLEQSKEKFPKDSPERKKLETFLKQVSEKLDKLTAGKALSNKKVVFSVSSSKEISEIAGIDAKGGDFVALGKNGYLLVFKDNSQIPIKTSLSPVSLTSDKNFVYVQTDTGVFRIDKKSKETKNLFKIKDPNGLVGMDNFLGNIYLLNAKEETIEKYPAGSYEKAAYLAGNATLGGKPVSFSIDSSVWVLLDTGEIKKFLKGKEEGYKTSGLPKAISADSLVYTAPDFANLYILDRKEKKVIVIGKDGSFKAQYDISSLEDARYIAVDERLKTVFIASPKQIISFTL